MEQLTLSKLINVSLRTIFSTFAIFTFFGSLWLLYVLTTTKQYDATALLQIEESKGRQTLNQLSYLGGNQG